MHQSQDRLAELFKQLRRLRTVAHLACQKALGAARASARREVFSAWLRFRKFYAGQVQAKYCGAF
jgi:hypothetical protein